MAIRPAKPGAGHFLIASSFSGFGNILSQPLYQLIQKERLALSFFEIGMARTTYFACLLIAYFVIGILIDKFDPEKLSSTASPLSPSCRCCTDSPKAIRSS
ncbi:hypothetical protein PACILC2_02130 [Paenibacillus cisolokensis]|uniref:Major facilitator superfamily (MFS) profile domain-containing protein n=1 Tax=Paenibacillus cisolokensis TaxID=1658519 RepID=A0ABQ4N0E0_9BACL|nr:hypothetical protein [Paenibacillus cisolokensis]GIQ61645.1 hypothetical protein PACILC2_02130 [Paenibacillus cisolokensis]